VRVFLRAVSFSSCPFLPFLAPFVPTLLLYFLRPCWEM
jgi:hypothetical protein